MKLFLKSFCLLSVLFSGASCSTLLNENNRELVVSAEPGSTIYFNGRNQGSSPARVQVAGTEILGSPTIRVEKEGYKTETVLISTHIKGWSVVSCLGLLPIVIDVATGNAMALSTHEMNVKLRKLS